MSKQDTFGRSSQQIICKLHVPSIMTDRLNKHARKYFFFYQILVKQIKLFLLHIHLHINCGKTE